MLNLIKEKWTLIYYEKFSSKKHFRNIKEQYNLRKIKKIFVKISITSYKGAPEYPGVFRYLFMKLLNYKLKYYSIRKYNFKKKFFKI